MDRTTAAKVVMEFYPVSLVLLLTTAAAAVAVAEAAAAGQGVSAGAGEGVMDLFNAQHRANPTLGEALVG